MRLDSNKDNLVAITLSESNLRHLLEDFESDGAAMALKRKDGVVLRVQVEDDFYHYSNRDDAA